MNSVELRNVRQVSSVIIVILLIAICRPVQSQPTEKARIDIQTLYTASGWMGDGEYGRQYIDFSGSENVNPHSAPTSIKVTYTFGPAGWGGIYWQNEPENWGDRPGNDYSSKDLSRVVFWARGETGTEVVEFKVGGIDNANKKHRDSFASTIGRIHLSMNWTQYQIDLNGADLSSVIGGFCWVAGADYNSATKISFFLDDIVFE